MQAGSRPQTLLRSFQSYAYIIVYWNSYAVFQSCGGVGSFSPPPRPAPGSGSSRRPRSAAIASTNNLFFPARNRTAVLASCDSAGSWRAAMSSSSLVGKCVSASAQSPVCCGVVDDTLECQQEPLPPARVKGGQGPGCQGRAVSPGNSIYIARSRAAKSIALSTSVRLSHSSWMLI